MNSLNLIVLNKNNKTGLVGNYLGALNIVVTSFYTFFVGVIAAQDRKKLSRMWNAVFGSSFRLLIFLEQKLIGNS